MLTLATNLLLWVLAVTNDSMHHEIESELNAIMEKFSGTEGIRPPCSTHTATLHCTAPLCSLKLVRLRKLQS